MLQLSLQALTTVPLPFQSSYGDQTGMGMVSSGLGLSYERGQFPSGHGPPHGMLRQKSIGEAVCLVCLPSVLLSVCLSSGPVHTHLSRLCCVC